ncbi:hypothetical protein AB6H14_18430 [Providencia vermicola]
MLNIRRISPREVQMRAWQQRYQPDADVVVPKSGERYFRLTLGGEKETVQVLVHVGEWCDYRWPTLIHYAWDALNEADLVSLFHSEYPRTLFSPNVSVAEILKLLMMRVSLSIGYVCMSLT